MKWSLDQLHTFLHVADFGGFSKAGNRLYRAQSTVSWQIQQLEKQIGCRLLHRTSDGVKLTDKGLAFYPKAQAVIAANNAAECWISDADENIEEIRFATTDCYAQTLLPSLLQRWKLTFPNVMVSVECGFSSDIWNRFRKNEFDIALAQHCPKDISAELVRVEPLEWVCAKEATFNTEPILPLALFTEGCPDRDIMLRSLETEGVRYRIEFESFSYAGLLAALSSGLVASALPNCAIPDSARIMTGLPKLPRLPNLAVVVASRRAEQGSIHGEFYNEIRLFLRNSTDTQVAV